LSVKAIITELLEQELDHAHYFVVGVHTDANEQHIRVYLDGAEGVSISYCARLSRRISHLLDEMEIDTGKFRYEISSPGADKPLVDHRQYPKHIGRELEVSLKGDEQVTGTLKKVNDESIELEIVLNKKKKVTESRTLLFENIQHSTVIISFKSVRR
jgi:ribosome maturation factor RimP